MRLPIRLCLALCLLAAPAGAQERPAGLDETIDNILAVMTFSVLPDTTASSLSINSPSSDDAGFTLFQLGGGTTLEGDNPPIYLEGFLGISQYDPDFIFEDSDTAVDARFTSFAATGGLGYDVALTPEWVLRPIFHLALGRVTSQATLLDDLPGPLRGGGDDGDGSLLGDEELNAYGVGGALMLDFTRQRPDYELDGELRYTHIELDSFGGSTATPGGTASASTLGVWGRIRWPTGVEVFDRPLRYVVDGGLNHFFGAQADALEFDYLARFGGGLEIDTSARPYYLQRARIVLRYLAGDTIRGFSLGIGLSF
ncbi:MAG: hypothetical protein ACFB3T_10530 [Geminicoccaceae bacterium]